MIESETKYSLDCHEETRRITTTKPISVEEYMIDLLKLALKAVPSPDDYNLRMINTRFIDIDYRYFPMFHQSVLRLDKTALEFARQKFKMRQRIKDEPDDLNQAIINKYRHELKQVLREKGIRLNCLGRDLYYID